MVDSLHLPLFPLWLRNDLKINSIESLWIEINDLIVGVIHKPPSVWNSEFLDKLETSHLNIIFFCGKNALLWATLVWKNSRYFATLPLVSPPKLRLRNERRNSILMTRHYPYLGSASDWLNQISHPAWPIRSTTQIWVVTRHQYRISSLVSQTSFGGETSLSCFLRLGWHQYRLLKMNISKEYLNVVQDFG